ncbi:glycoside hydrolase family 18 protein [Mycena maculata]|uniref:Glycoside hydrolase family 18 protein n=1 Tax=Mycena maculata TaxID=230809 RepID=A0AAD7JKZ4_9AGAR|nr:glycoside hydrolase family 18 protein [Mycena maculata]
MVSFRWTSFAAIAPIFLYFGRTTSTTVNATSLANDSAVHNHSSPHFLVYSDQETPGTIGPPAVSAIKGFNVFALSFLLASGPADKVPAGIKLIVSAFGSTESPTTSGTDPNSTAETMAEWVRQYDLDGIDVDYEDFTAVNKGDGKAEAWIINFTTRLRSLLPQGQYILTHAPVAPWFSPGIWGGGGYLKVHESVGHMIDWYNIQYYNQGDTEYTTCSNTLAQSSSQWPQSALFQIAANGVPLRKLVLGKPATNTSADNGYITPATLTGCVETAKNGGWSAGVSTWEYPGAASSWIQTVRGVSWPVEK